MLTRAAMLVAAAAGDRLAAQEGAFGSRLVEREPASPSLKWGRGGVLDLRQPLRRGHDRGAATHRAASVDDRLGTRLPDGAPRLGRVGGGE